MQKKQSNLSIFAILTTITILTWVFVEAYQKFYQTQVLTVPANILSPVSPTFDTSILDKLAQKKQVTQEEINLYKKAAPQATPKPKVATSSSEQKESTSAGATQ